MTDENRKKSPSDEVKSGTDRRNFLISGAAGLAAVGAGITPATATPASGQQLRTNSPSGERVAVITDAQTNIAQLYFQYGLHQQHSKLSLILILSLFLFLITFTLSLIATAVTVALFSNRSKY